ncbi:MAG: murein biosynthesis integral membrane protein MurJ [Candidatus Paracaedibacteraceae bacterium]|nr:murein biosynthesis integral membrane protein MurJ [Candidatus Paracaedibacteraceae bacterium]
MALYRSFFTVGLLTILSRIVGFLREILTASLLGAGATSDALKIAMKLPSLFRRIFAEGAFNASFVPMFAALFSKPENRQEALTFAEQILSWLTLFLCILIIIVEIFLPSIFKILAPGFDPERLSLTIKFTRITFPFILFISLTAFYSGILNSLDRFFLVASSPVIGNIFILIFVTFATKVLSGEPGIDFSIAVFGCGVVQLLWVLIPSIYSGYGINLKFPTISPRVKVFFRKVGPGALGAGVVQINILIDMIIGSRLPAGYISYLDYAERLNQLPLSVIGTAISTVLLPLMSRHVAAGKAEESLATQRDSIEFAMLLTLPSMCGLIVWAVPIVGMVFQHGKFTLIDTQATAAALIAFAIGLPAYILIKIFSTTFFSNQDTKTPVIVAVCSVVLNLLLNLLLVDRYMHVGLAMATATSAWLNALVLAYLLHKRKQFVISNELKIFCARLLLSIMIALPFIYGIKFWLHPVILYNVWWKAIFILLASVGGVSVFATSAWITGALNLGRFKSNMRLK